MLMKKSNKILVGCLALLLVMAVGYALFSETITINGTATAKGEFNMEVTCTPGFNSDRITLEEYGELYSLPKAEGGYKNDTCLVNNNVVSFSSELGYPGATRYFTIKITNNGTMDAVYDFSSSNLVDEKICVDGLRGSENGILEENECESILGENDILSKAIRKMLKAGIKNENTSLTLNIPIIQFETADGIIFDLMDENAENYFEEFIPDDDSKIILKPGSSIYVGAVVGIDESYGDDDDENNLYYLSYSTSYKLLFSQKTAN